MEYTAHDIEKYWKGELPPDRMHQMEKDALNDTFLADAMDGYASTAASPLAQADLQQRLDARIEGDRTRSGFAVGTWWKVAASVIVLVGAGAIYFMQYNDEKATAPVVADEQAAPNKTAPFQQELAKEDTTARDRVALQPDSAAPIVTSRVAASPKALPTKPRFENDSISATQEILSGLAKNQSDAAAAAPPPPLADARQKEEVQRALSNQFEGIVINSENKPVPNATITLNGKISGIKTDENGYFKVNTADESLNLSVKSNGYLRRDVTMKYSSNRSMPIVLNEYATDRAPSVAKGKRQHDVRQAAESKPGYTSLSAAEPSVGWSRYEQYLDSAVRKTTGLADTIHGPVLVSFEVDRLGAMKNFTILRSLHARADEAAINIIRNGPRWTVQWGLTGTATAIIRF